MHVTWPPGGNLREPVLRQVVVAVPSSVNPRIRVPVQCKYEWTHWITKCFPRFRAAFSREADPRRRTSAELALDIGLRSISLPQAGRGRARKRHKPCPLPP
jgi:hypothetical protein